MDIIDAYNLQQNHTRIANWCLLDQVKTEIKKLFQKFLKKILLKYSNSSIWVIMKVHLNLATEWWHKFRKCSLLTQFGGLNMQMKLSMELDLCMEFS